MGCEGRKREAPPSEVLGERRLRRYRLLGRRRGGRRRRGPRRLIRQAQTPNRAISTTLGPDNLVQISAALATQERAPRLLGQSQRLRRRLNLELANGRQLDARLGKRRRENLRQLTDATKDYRTPVDRRQPARAAPLRRGSGALWRVNGGQCRCLKHSQFPRFPSRDSKTRRRTRLADDA